MTATFSDGETLEETQICFLRQQDFKNLLLKYPELSLKLLETTVRRAAEMRYQAQFLMMEDVESRIANYLLQLVKVVDSNSVMISMKMKDLATFIGTTPETISRKFKILEEKGFIERRGKIIKILDIENYLINILRAQTSTLNLCPSIFSDATSHPF